MAVFESLGKLGDWAVANGIEVVDPGVPLLSYDPEDRPGAGYRSPPVRSVVDFIARQIATLPLKVYELQPDGSKTRVRDGLLAELVKNPSVGIKTSSRLWYSLICDGLLSDRMLAVLEQRDGTYKLRRIPPRRWQTVPDVYDEVASVRISDGGGNWKSFDPSDGGMLIDVGFATSQAKGESQLRTLKRVIAEYESSMDYRAQVNKNGARAPFAILRDREWPDEGSRNRFQNGMKDFAGPGGGGGNGLLLEDGMKPEKLDIFKPIDVGDLDARDRVKLDVANAYGIPGELIGLREGNFSNIAAFRQMLFGIYLRPYITTFEQAFNRCIVPEVPDIRSLYVELDADAQLRGDPTSQYKALSTATGRPFLATNEARSTLNLPPKEGGDGLVTPLNVTIGGQSSPQDGQSGGSMQTGEEDAD